MWSYLAKLNNPTKYPAYSQGQFCQESFIFDQDILIKDECMTALPEKMAN